MHTTTQAPTESTLNHGQGRRKLKIAAFGLTLLAAAWVIGSGLIYHEMCKPPEEFGRFMTRIPPPLAFMAFPFETMWLRARRGSLNVGDAAPDFFLSRLHGKEYVRLSEMHASQPVVLVFGSYT